MFPHLASRIRTGTLLAAVLCLAPIAAFAQPAMSPGNPPPMNLHVVVGEDFLNRLIARQDVRPGPVHENLNDVQINGEQCTYTDLRVDLLPASDKAFAQFVLNGNVQSRTTGVTDQAVIHAQGNMNFRATKDLLFDGNTISTRHAAVVVLNNNQNLGFQTKFDGTPLGGIANRVAQKMAEQRKPQTDEMTRQRIVQRVQPMLDTAVDKQLADLNDKLESDFRSKLRQFNLLPPAQQVTTTDQYLHYAAAVGDAAGPISPPRSSLVAPHGVNFFLHESAINGLIGRLKLNGLKLTDKDLQAMRSRFGNPAKSSMGLPFKMEAEIEFDNDRPVAVEFQNDYLVLRLRLAVRVSGQEFVPPSEVTLPLQLVPGGDGWKLTAGEITVVALHPGDRVPDMAVTALREGVNALLPAAELPRELPVPNWPAGKAKPNLSAIRAADGWLVISLD